MVIPAKNEAANLPWVLRRLPALVDEVVLVDGNSTDDTVDVARSIRPDVVVVDDEGAGKGRALRQGFDAANGDVIVMIDADGSMDPREIASYVAALRGGYDLVKGSRYLDRGGSDDITLVRSFGNRFFCGLFNTLYAERFTDLCYGYVAFRRSALPRLELRADGFEIEAELISRAARCGLAIGEVPSFESPRRYGTSNLRTFRDGFRVLRTLLGERVARRRRVGPAVPAPAVGPASELELLEAIPAMSGAARDAS